jgi:hypothetical protein
METTDFIEGSILHGLKFDEFIDLPEPTRRKLVNLMARLSEKSYRRGVQQALTIGCIHDVCDWRYGPLEKSIGINTQEFETVAYRHSQQNSELRQVGL